MDWVPIIVALVALIGTILTPIIKDRLDKKNGVQATIERIEKKLDDHTSEQDNFNLMRIRNSILSFARDISIWKSGKGSNWVTNNKELWDEQLQNLEFYDYLCKRTGDHNGRIDAARELIVETYKEVFY